jgi:hypothetical protein
MNDQEYDGLACTFHSILFLCCMVYVKGDYHLFGSNMPFLRDTFDWLMKGMTISEPVLWLFYALRMLRRSLIESVRHSLRP